MPNAIEWQTIGIGFLQSIYMTFLSTALAYVIGLPLGLLLVVSDKDGLHPCPVLNAVLGVIVNILRSLPFLILAVLFRPFTRAVVGTTIGSNATVVALVIASAPYVARLVESSIKEVDRGVIEAAESMGASTSQIVWKVLLPEARPSLLVGGAIAITTILSYSAMAGFIGGGGLGDIAIRYGYYRYQSTIMFITSAILVVIVQVLQAVGMKLARIGDKRIS